ncbi:hypothetical protein CMV30_10230 [Nibricoccus aquaticus]|uniref:HTH marR-type domain-containing protein n=1 Tax=Nibricoccus aquaticus TaxID=2576891 RepID=A0A290Q6L8_9BACT|nr:MarR family winged helix-turn-helix transcriptional regulator [Nibricoccus aquaticus]ATC64299.1 hypothetical protein CMV30_10230 [Nibricoccus aquaticus]
MPKAARKSPRPLLRRKRRSSPPCLDAGCAHAFITTLFTTLSALRDSLVRIYSPSGLNEHKFAVLTALAAQSPAPSLATQLARAAGITRASMTDLLDDLERRHWIARSRDRSDRRVIQVHLTTLGQEVVDTTNAHFKAICHDLLGEASPQELNRLARLCGNIGQASRSICTQIPPFQPPGAQCPVPQR